MPSVPTLQNMRALRFSLVSGLLVGILELLGTPLAPALSNPYPSLAQKPHRAAAVCWGAAHGQAEAQARRCGHGYSRRASGQRVSWLMRGHVAAEPSEPGPDSEDCPDPLEIVPAGVSRPALVRMSALCLRVAGAVLLHVTAGQSRAPPPVVA
jgi:hypothetical protein